MADQIPDEVMRLAERFCNDFDPSSENIARLIMARDTRAADLVGIGIHKLSDKRTEPVRNLLIAIHDAILTYDDDCADAH